MKNLKFFFLGLLCANLFLFSSCGSDDEDGGGDPEPEIVDIVATAQATADLSMLVEAVIKTDLTTTLQSAGPFTVFAPNNAAFQALLDDNADWSSIDDIPTDALKDILLFHVLGADVKSTDLTDSYVTTASLGPDDKQVALQIDVTGGIVFNGSANVITADVEATNGTVHIINEVMSRPTVVNHALNNPEFSSLVAALTRTGDDMTDFVAVLSGDGPFTVFAPTNAAFDALIAGNDDWDSLADIDEATLDAVLKYHVVNAANVQAGQLTDGQVVGMLNGSDITIDLSDGAKISTATQSVDIIITDVQGTNGVVHAVNAVLIP